MNNAILVESYMLAMHLLDKIDPNHQACTSNVLLAPYMIHTCPIEIKIMAVSLFLAKFYYRLKDSEG
jgi:hypothetical protein